MHPITKEKQKKIIRTKKEPREIDAAYFLGISTLLLSEKVTIDEESPNLTTIADPWYFW